MGMVFDLDLPMNRKIVLLKLADCGNDEGENVYPSLDTLARCCSIGRSTVSRIKAELVAEGILIPVGNIGGGRGKRPIYRLNVPLLQSLAEQKGSRSENLSGPKGSQSGHLCDDKGSRSGTLSGEKVLAGEPKGSQSLRHKPLVNPPKKKNGSADDGDADPPPPGAIGCAAWDHARDRLLAEFGEATYRSWLAPLVLIRPPPDATVWAATRMHAGWVEQHYGGRIAENLGSRVRFEWGQQATAPSAGGAV